MMTDEFFDESGYVFRPNVPQRMMDRVINCHLFIGKGEIWKDECNKRVTFVVKIYKRTIYLIGIFKEYLQNER
jgi:hypothetical protein